MASKPKGIYKRAFANQYNMIFLGGTALFALTTMSWIPLIVGVGVEALWMTLGPDTRFFKRWAALQDGLEAQEAMQRSLTEGKAVLEPAHKAQLEKLEALAGEIRELAQKTPGVTTTLMEAELEKLDELLGSFLRLAKTKAELGAHLSQIDEETLEKELKGLKRRAGKEKNQALKESIQQSLSVTEKRAEQIGEMKASVEALDLQLNTIQKSFQYLKSSLVNASSMESFAKELDGLIAGVDAVEQSCAETGAFGEDAQRRALAQRQARALRQ